MPDQVPDRFSDLQSAFAWPDSNAILVLAASLLLGGALGLYIRFLYRMTSPQAASDSIARVFPLLTMVTITVIAVVKGSLALSLGLVGALSIVRFRAAIKDPEELVYLFLCIGVGLALGAVQVWLAVALVATTTVFVLIFDRFRPGRARTSAYLTVTGSAERHFAGGADDALELVREKFPHLRVERCDVDGEEGQLRVQLPFVDASEAPKLVTGLRERMAGCRISFVNAESLPG